MIEWPSGRVRSGGPDPCSTPTININDSKIKKEEEADSEIKNYKLGRGRNRNGRYKIYILFLHGYSPVMYTLYEVDIPLHPPPPPSKAVQDRFRWNPKPLSPILQLKTGKYADDMCCVQLLYLQCHLFHYCISLYIPLKLRGRYQLEFETNNNKPRRRHLAKMSPSWSFVEINCAWISFWMTRSQTKR